jgi:hypothetical protein
MSDLTPVGSLLFFFGIPPSPSETGVTRRYLLPAAASDAGALEGLLDREGFGR